MLPRHLIFCSHRRCEVVAPCVFTFVSSPSLSPSTFCFLELSRMAWPTCIPFEHCTSLSKGHYWKLGSRHLPAQLIALLSDRSAHSTHTNISFNQIRACFVGNISQVLEHGSWWWSARFQARVNHSWWALDAWRIIFNCPYCCPETRGDRSDFLWRYSRETPRHAFRLARRTPPSGRSIHPKPGRTAASFSIGWVLDTTSISWPDLSGWHFF